MARVVLLNLMAGIASGVRWMSAFFLHLMWVKYVSIFHKLLGVKCPVDNEVPVCQVH